jgi:hypothetical protein
MRLPLVCFQCQFDETAPKNQLYYAELQDDGLYHLKCKQEHDSATCLQNQRFELLFDLALNAILDGYYREAVVSFTSAAESFYEFYLRVIMAKRNVSIGEYEKAWKRVESQSERQFGAYTLVYTLEQCQPPPILHPSKVNFRNKVIHRGKIPTRAEAEEYGQATLETISPVLSYLKLHENSSLQQVIGNYVADLRSEGKMYAPCHLTERLTLSHRTRKRD